MSHPYIEDDILHFVIGEVEFLTELGETFESAMSRTRQALIDSIDVAFAVSGFLRDLDRNTREMASEPRA